MKMLKALLLLLMMSLIPAVYAAPALSHPAQIQLQQNVDTVLNIARKKSLSEPQKIAQIEHYADRYLDYQRVSALAVGLPWKQFTPQQQREFIAAFKNMVVRMYAHSALVGAANATVTVLPKIVSQGQNRVDTFTTIRSANGKTHEVAYQMYQVGNVYKIYNFRVDGASLVTIYRSQFNDMIQKQGIDGTIQTLRQKDLSRIRQ